MRMQMSKILAALVPLVLGLGVFFTLSAWPAGRMTGGGSFFVGDLRVTHGFELYCQPESGDPVGPNNLEVNWGPGDHFHLENLVQGYCQLGPDPTPPAAPISIYYGVGTGSFDGVEGYCAQWTFIDAGEPGTSDTAWIKITNGVPTGTLPPGKTCTAGTTTVLNAFNLLTFGNHQAHFLTGGKSF